MTLSGSYDVVPSHDLRNSQPITDGTVLIPTAGRGVECDINCTDAFIYCTENSLVRGLVILHDEQERVETPVPYPWAIFLGDPHHVYSGSADNAAVEDVELLGAWNGVAAVQAHRHYIARVMLFTSKSIFICFLSDSTLTILLLKTTTIISSNASHCNLTCPQSLLTKIDPRTTPQHRSFRGRNLRHREN